MKSALRLYGGPASRGFTGVLGLFFAGMWLSKTAQVILFERTDNLALFGYSYAVMACAGAVAAIIVGPMVDRHGHRVTLPIGIAVYAVALATRSVPEQSIVVLVGAALAAVGATAVLVSLRPLTTEIASLPKEPDIEGVVALRKSVDDIAIVGAGGLFTVVIWLFGESTSSFRAATLGAALIVACAAVAAGFFLRTPALQGSPPLAGTAAASPKVEDKPEVLDRVLHTTLLASAAVAAIYISFVIPTLPLLAERRGIPIAWVGFSFTVIGIGKFVSTLVYGATASGKHSKLLRFIVAEVLVGFLSMAAAAAFGAPFFLILFIRGAVVAIGSVAEEALQLELIPPANLGKVFGQLQAAFLAGDVVGGLIAPLLIEAGMITQLFVGSGVLAIINGVFAGVMIARRTRVPVSVLV